MTKRRPNSFGLARQSRSNQRFQAIRFKSMIAARLFSTLVLACMLSGCDSHPTAQVRRTNIPVTIVSSSDLEREREALSTRTTSDSGRYETWERYHDALCKVARGYGSVSDSPEPTPDFYFSGDWYHELSDGFALLTTNGLSSQALREFQSTVSAHHPGARLDMGGEIATSLAGLKLLITGSGIFVAWEGQTATGCKGKLSALGVSLE